MRRQDRSISAETRNEMLNVQNPLSPRGGKAAQRANQVNLPTHKSALRSFSAPKAERLLYA